MDVSGIRKPGEWPFPIPEITADAIDEYIAAYERDDIYLGDYYDDLDGATREMDDPDEEDQVRAYYLLDGWRRG